MSMFGSTNHQKATQRGWPVVELQNLGYEEKQKTGVVNFVPLFGIDPAELGVKVKADEVLPITLDELENGETHSVFTFFSYEGMWEKADGSGREKRIFKWVDTTVEKGKDGSEIGDPGRALGLDLPSKERMNIPCFGNAGTMQFAANDAYVTLWRVPVLWEVELNSNGDVVDGSGTPSLLEVNGSQYANIVELFSKLTKKKTTYINDDDSEVGQPFLGTGFVFQIDKDTTKRKPDRKDPGSFYVWSKLDGVALNTHLQAHFAEARERVASWHDWVMDNRRFYQAHIDAVMAGEITPVEAERLVMSDIQKRLLEMWGEPYKDSVDGILTTFEKVVPRYNVAKGSNYLNNVLSSTTVDVGEDAPF